MEKPRLVLDTNVVVSAVLKPDGLQRLIFQVALSPFCKVFVSAPILTEYEEVLSRKRFKLQPDEVQAILRLIISKTVADYLVTGNKKHFPSKWKQTKVVSGREMMTLMLRGLLEL